MIKLPPPFANTPGLTREEISRYDERGPAWAWYTLTIGEHVGTHRPLVLDAKVNPTICADWLSEAFRAG